MTITRLDHIQLTMPEGKGDKARDFYSGLLGLEEIQKPPPLKNRGGVWFQIPTDRQLHLGVEIPFVPNKKAHPCFVTSDLTTLAERLAAAGLPVTWDKALAPLKCFYSEDVFGNRLEFVGSSA